ncbi:hypothetical protein NE237_004933 [Protea cynaroides]|uniref:Thioesterase domain-containing protein n=1 Tax=Protea cynaroides TaxID=273540 RepID=A0A9Q0QU54_9MAGN|nr:hypothetical protein NE237_004933 [Protea cynaroides]
MGSGSESSSSKTLPAPDEVLNTFGFEIEELSPKRVRGHLKVSDDCCQSWKMLHGGVVAVIAESLASLGAHMSSGFRRIAGIQLSINHFAAAHLGDVVMADATPITLDQTIQVWMVQFWKINPSTHESTKALISTSNVTIISNLPIAEKLRKAAAVPLTKYAKL